MADESDIREREKFAHHEMCKDLKRHYEHANIKHTSESIEREVHKMAENIAKKKDHEIYKK